MKIIRIILVISITTVLSLIGGYYYFSWGLPDVQKIQEVSPAPSVQILDRNGRLLYEDMGESVSRYHPLDYKEIPSCLKQATIATEDIRFFSNPGFDFPSILRALWQNLSVGQTITGASTITQQLVRNYLLQKEESSQRTFTRKIREIILAWKLTHSLSKEEILTLYLNRTYYGSFAYGVEAASLTFFGKSARELDLAQCALIAGLPQAPSYYNPFVYFNNAKTRQEVVLKLMLDAGFIDREQYVLAVNEPLNFSEAPYPMEAPHFVMLVRNQFDNLLSQGILPDNIKSQNLVINTTLDLDLQHLAEQAIRSHLQKLSSERDGLGHNVNNAALVSMNPETGEVLALVGSADYFDQAIHGAINMAVSPRQPGSALKSLVYALAMEPGNPSPLTPNSYIWDLKTTFTTRDGKSYMPLNYDGKEHGVVTVRQALGSSLNIPAVIILNEVGLERFSAHTKRLGIHSLDNPETYDLTVALGGGGVTLLELTNAYGVFASLGYYKEPVLIKNITIDKDNRVIYQTPNTSKQVMDEKVAWLISDILSDDQARMIGFGLNSVLNIDRRAAVKTGTTTNFHDNWAIGYTPQLVTGVWVGNSDYQAMIEVTGLTGAAPIWHQFMRSALVNMPEVWYPKVEGIVRGKGCKPAAVTDLHCVGEDEDWMIAGTHSITLPTYIQQKSQIMNPPEPFTILSPSAGAVYYLSNTNTANRDKLLIEVRSDSQINQFAIFINNIPLAILDKEPYQAWMEMNPGTYQIRIEGWYGSQFISSKTIQITIKPPLR